MPCHKQATKAQVPEETVLKLQGNAVVRHQREEDQVWKLSVHQRICRLIALEQTAPHADSHQPQYKQPTHKLSFHKPVDF